jgi:hypothetical protein
MSAAAATHLMSLFKADNNNNNNNNLQGKLTI